VGYDAFFEPAREFELHARAGRLAELERGLRELQALAARVQPPPETPSETPLILDKA
jgi:hypothetical protein